MSIADFRELGDSPNRPSASPNGSILQAFPPTSLGVRLSNGYRFRLDPCGVVTGYDPEYCEPGEPKMEPNFYGPEVQVPVRMLQSAFACSLGATEDELRTWARSPLELRLWSNVDSVLTQLLATQAVDQTPGPIAVVDVLARAAQYLATHGLSGTGIIYGPQYWVSQLGMDFLIRWDEERGVYFDAAGNIVIPSSQDIDTVYAFDSLVDIKISDIRVLDDFMPALRTTNDRVVRAEQLYTVAIGPCVVGSFDIGATTGGSVNIEPGVNPIVVTELPGTITNGHETPVSTVAVQILAANLNRKKYIIQNTGSANIRVGVAGVTANTGLRLVPSGTIIMEMPDVPTQAIFAIREGASDSIAFSQEIT